MFYGNMCYYAMDIMFCLPVEHPYKAKVKWLFPMIMIKEKELTKEDSSRQPYKLHEAQAGWFTESATRSI